MQADVSRTAHELRQSRRWRSIVVRPGVDFAPDGAAGNANQVRAGGVPGKVVHSNEFHALHESCLLAQKLDPSYEGLEVSQQDCTQVVSLVYLQELRCKHVLKTVKISI
jgi:hypothetical protein